MSNSEFSRRQFLAVAPAAVVGWAAAVSGAQAQEKPSELFGLLSQSKSGKAYAWMDQHGKEVNLNALKTAELNGKYATLVFGFQGCKTFCTKTNEKLKALRQMNDNMVHVVVSVTPEDDGTPEGRKKYTQELMEALGLKENEKDKLIVLYPIKKGSEAAPVFQVENAIELQNRLEFPAHIKRPAAHSPYIYLYDPSGKKIAEKSGTDPVEDFQAWKDLMPKQQEQGK